MATADNSNSSAATLAERLRERIRLHGPINFHGWMQSALYDEREGYYSRSDRVRWGRRGDYRTAPETSPLFAATLARYCAALITETGAPASWTFVEVGAGSGEFAYSFLSTLQSRYPELLATVDYLIDEVSADARGLAATRLAPFGDRVKFVRLSDIGSPIAHGIVFSNEVIDAFPVHRIIRRGTNLRELYVALNADGEFVWIEDELSKEVAAYCTRTELSLVDGQFAEVNLAAEEFVARVAALLEQGSVITVDYGAERADLLSAPHRREGTLRAFQSHQLMANCLTSPGEQDLTTTIDWTQIREAGASVGLETVRYESLDKFLLREGLLEELEALTSGLPESEALRLRTGAREMIMPHGLSASFQILIQTKRN